MITKLNVAHDAEYAEVLQRLPELHRELAGEQARGRLTYAEVEESEADLHRFQAWLAKIEARDYFGAAFENAALDAETSGPASAAGRGRSGLRAVDRL